MASERRRFAAIALVSATVILLQISLTRLLSVLVWYHWAFFSISLSLLGVGAPGVWFALRRPNPELLPRLLLAAAGLLPASVVLVVKATRHCGSHSILFILLVLLPGLLCLGSAICQLLLEAEGPAIGRMYGFDLLGAALGAVLVVPLMTVLPTPQLAGALGLLPLVAYLAVGGNRRTAGVLAIGLLGLLAWGEAFRLRHPKAYAEIGPRATPIYERWTPTARITIFDNVFWTDTHGAFGWGMGARPAPMPAPRQYWLEQDGSAGTPITEFDGDTRKLLYLFHDVTSVGYQLRPPRTVAIVGPGGGRDILTALAAGAEKIRAIELNQAVVEALRGRFGEFTGHLYDLPEVETVVGEGRSVLARSPQQYDLLQISLIDSWAATAAGAYSLSENNLYTLEAYRLFWSRLTPRGMVSTTRWMVGGFGLELPRLLFLHRAALLAEGVRDPLQHLVMLQGGAVGTVLMSRSPFTEADLSRLQQTAFSRGFTIHLPDRFLPAEQRWIRRIWDAGPPGYDRWGLRMDPPTDDRPFFFQALSPLRPILPDVAARAGINAEGVTALQTLMLAVAALAGLLFFLPFPLTRWLRPQGGFWRGSAFFTAIGLGFMLVEVSWIQRFILLLGHPSLAVTVGLGSLLLGAGLGSLGSRRVGPTRARRWGFMAPLSVAAVSAALGPVSTAVLGWSWPLRAATAVGLLVPCGVLLGCFFPLGMVRFGEPHKAWFWAVNGAASVVASVVSLALAMETGFSRVGYLGVGLYVVAWLLFRGKSVQSAAGTVPEPTSPTASPVPREM
jgi:hypothetical protein